MITSRCFVPAALFLLVLGAVLPPLLQADTTPVVQASILFATNQSTPKVDAGAAPFAADLQRVFGYNSFAVIGSQTRQLPDPSENWIIPSKTLYLKLYARPQDGALRVYSELYESDRLLLGLKADLALGKPLFIRGPQWTNGQIIILLIALPPGAHSS